MVDQTNPSSPTGASSQRRSSNGLAGLLNMKRDPTDTAAAARRQSVGEQMRKPGVFGRMWNSYVKGSSPPKNQGAAGASK